VQQLSQKNTGVSLHKRRRGLKSFKDSFTGEKAVEWLVSHNFAKTKEEAVALGNRMIRLGYIHHVTDKHVFGDDEYLYRFTKDESGAPTVLVASENILGISGHRTTEQLHGIVQNTMVEGVVREKALRKYYYTEQNIPEEGDNADYLWQKKKQRTLHEMEVLLNASVLTKADLTDIEYGHRIMICVDGTYSSSQAFHNTLSTLDPKADFIFLVAVRERDLPAKLAFHARSTPERIRWEFSLWLTTRQILSPLRNKLLEMEFQHMILAPQASNAKKKIMSLVKQYRINQLVVSKHLPGERSSISIQDGRILSFHRHLKSKCDKLDCKLIVK